VADFAVADVHTAPTDAGGGDVGWVLHVGTGPVDLAVVSAEGPDGGFHAYVGPVATYYEHLAVNYKRLTDEDWASAYAESPSLRPSWVNLYLTNEKGESRGVGPSLVTGIDGPVDAAVPASFVLHNSYPNPFNSATTISVTVAGTRESERVTLGIYDLLGRQVATLYRGTLMPGNYVFRWDGTNGRGVSGASGVYFCRLDHAGGAVTQRATLLR
jgi:hypothetical protein